MLEFIPFVPAKTEGITETVWKTALKSWNHNLAELLNMSEEAFLQETSSNNSLIEFVDQVFDAQMDDIDSVDTSCLRLIFYVYLKLSSLEVSSSHPLLSVDKLCSFVVIYGDTNTQRVRQIIRNLANSDESLEQQLLSVMSGMVETVQSIPNLFCSTAPIELLDNVYVLVRVLDSLLSATLFLGLISSSFENLDQTLLNCYKELSPKLKNTVEKQPEAAPYAYLVKKTLVSAFNSYADAILFYPLGCVSSLTDHHQLLKLSEEDSNVLDISKHSEFMSSKIFGYIETSDLKTDQAAFVDGPLVMDWEVEYHITEKLQWINEQLFDSEDTHVEFLKLSMEQVRDSNAGTGSWGASLAQKEKAVNQEDSSDLELSFKISQIHDLFPDLGDGFIEVCLTANQGDTEQVIMQLIENNLPPSVINLDRKMERKQVSAIENYLESESESEEPYETGQSLLQSRRNIYDNDEFDIFNRGKIDTSNVYLGKKDKGDADDLLEDKEFIQNEKSKVLRRVVDMYDDDYDDTYDDINDAGVPSSTDNTEGDAAIDIVKKKHQEFDPSIQNESLLVNTLVSNPDLFNRSSTVRKSAKRAELREATGMSDEQLEGWAIMLNRNPRKQRILDKYMLYDGNQTELSKEPAKSKKQPSSKDPKKPNAPNVKDTKKSPAAEAKDRSAKTKNKASVGNHNRKAMRDKKIAKVTPQPDA